MGAESSTMQNAAATTCKGCKNLGNKQVDTVKLDMEKFRDESSLTAAAGKENSDPGQTNEREKEQQRLKMEAEVREEEARRRACEEAEERQRQLELAEMLQKQKEEEEAAAERRRIAAEEEEARRRDELNRIAEENKRQQQAEVMERLQLRRIQKEEEERLLKQKEEEEEALRRQAEQEEEAKKKQRLEAFLSKAGFEAATEKKVKKGIISSGFSYPLHAAVEQKDAEAIELLLWAGADPCLANSKKLTPLKLANAKNKQGSHDKVIAALAA